MPRGPKMPENWISPGDAIKKFAADLPNTIKDSVLVGCNSAFVEPSLANLHPEKFQVTFNSILDNVRPRKRAAECAKLIGVMELALQQSGEGDEEFYKEAAEETGLIELSTMAMRAPLRHRHYKAARARFREMRETVMSARALHLWKGLLEEEDPIWPLDEPQSDDGQP